MKNEHKTKTGVIIRILLILGIIICWIYILVENHNQRGIYVLLYDNNKDKIGDTVVFSKYNSSNSLYGTLISTINQFDKIQSNKQGSYWDKQYNSVTKIVFSDKITPVSLAHWFDGFGSCCNKTIEVDNEKNLDTKKVKNMSYMFANTEANIDFDFSQIDTSHVKNMSHMFDNAYAMNIDNLNTNKVKNMSYMFANTNIDHMDVSKLSTANVVNMEYMFYGSTTSKDINLNNFSISKVSNLTAMFYRFSANSLDLSSFNLNSIQNVNNVRWILMETQLKTGLKITTSFLLNPSFDYSTVQITDIDSIKQTLNLIGWKL